MIEKLQEKLGRFSGVISSVVQLIVATLIWMPFMRSADREVYNAEQSAETAGKEA